MILGNTITTDARFGGTGPGGLLMPADTNPKDKEKQPEIDLGPFQQRWQLMRLEAMSKWYQRWRDLSRFINPKRGFFEGFVPNYNAQYDYRLIIDDNPAYYARVLAAGMSSGLTSPSMRWFRLGVGDQKLEENESVKKWLGIVENVIYEILARSKAYDVFQQTYEELGLFGTGSFGIFEDFETVARFKSYTIGEYYLACDAAGRINGFARQLWMTADQLVEEYGWNNVGDQVKATYNAGNRDQYFLVYTLCEKNSTRTNSFSHFDGMPWRSVTWEAINSYKKPLRVSGHMEFPYMGPRWNTTTTSDIYGYGPGQEALGNIKMLQRMQKDSLLAINKVADPPVQVDASVEGAPDMLPGGITRSSATVPNVGVRPAYEVNPDINAIEAKIEKTDKKIAARFYADLFMMMLNSEPSEKTAREIVERHEEKLLMLGPVLGRVKDDMIDPALTRVFALAYRAKLIPPAPKVIQGMSLKIEIISLLAQAQKMAQTAAIEQAFAFVGSVAGVFPDAKDNIDYDAAVRRYSDMLGVDASIIRGKDAVAQIRAARAQKQAEIEAQSNALAAVQGAGNLAKIPVGGGNALSHILGVGGEQSGVGQPTPGGTA